MICPHCGKNTRAGELCEYCKKPTEFVSRSNIRPGIIPGEPKHIPNSVTRASINYENKQSPRLWIHTAVLTVVVILTAVITWILCFRLPMRQVQTIEETKPAMYQTEPISAESTQIEIRVVFDYNFPQQRDTMEEISAIGFGDMIPELPDEDGYTFLGWNTDSSGKGTSFQPGEQFMILLAEDLILYGQWVQEEETVIERWKIPVVEVVPPEIEPVTRLEKDEEVETTESVEDETKPTKTTEIPEETPQEENVEDGEQQ